MAFSFGLPIAQQDPNGVDLGSALARLSGQGAPGYAPQPQPDPTQQPAPQAAPQPQAPASGQSPYDIPVSPLEAVLSWAAHGGSPGEAAQRVRAVKLQNMMDGYQLQQAQIRQQTLQNATGQQQQAILFNPAEYGKQVAANFAPIQTAEGASQTMFGGASQPGGYTAIAPKLMLGSAGQPIALTQNGMVSLGPQLDGKKTAANGVVLDENKGLTGQTYTQPQVFAPGSSPGVFTSQVGGVAPQGPLQGSVSGPLGAGGPPQSPAIAAPPAGAAPSKFDALNFIKSFVIPHEGGLNPHDMNGAPTKFGINQAANPGVNVPGLTAGQAADIYMKKYLPMSGAANLPPALAAVHLDTSVINPAKAQQFLQQSNGDPAAYLALRQQWMQHMLQTNPAAAPYAKAWGQRNADLGQIIAGQGGAGQQGAQLAQGGGQPGWFIGAPVGQPRTLTPEEVKAHGYADGTVVERAADGAEAVRQAPQYDSAWDRGQRDSFAGWEPVKQYTSVVQPSYQALTKNIGQMTGPAAYAILDTVIRTDNPGATTRQQQLDSFEQKFGLGASFMGKLLNYAGKGSIPKDVQQKILDSVAPFAQSHYDAANSLYQAQVGIANEHKRNPNDLTVPIGQRPEHYVVAGTDGALPDSQIRQQAQAAIAKGGNKAAIIARMRAAGVDTSGL